MGIIPRKKHNQHLYQNVLHWAKLISVTGSAQIVVQIITLFSGILVIRVLLTKEYAFYTIANSMLGTMTLLADGGISTGVMSQGGKVWNDKEKLGAVLVTGLYLRRRFAIYSLLVSIPILSYLLWHNGATFWQIATTVLCLIPAFFAALSDSLLEIAPKLSQDIVLIQKNQLFTNVVRLLMLCATIFLWPFTFIALLANGIPRFLGNINLKKIAATRANLHQQKDPAIEKEILKIVFRCLPEFVFYCLAGQITIWLLSLFSGSVSSIAQVGAIGRIAVIVNFITVMCSSFIIPRYARLPTSYHLLLKRFLQIFSGLVIFSAIVVFFVWLFASPMLYVLGEKYAGLNYILLLYFVGSCLGFISGMTFSIYASRGWILHPLVSIPYNFATLAAGIFLFDITKIEQVLFFNIYLASTQILLHLLYILYKINGLRKLAVQA